MLAYEYTHTDSVVGGTTYLVRIRAHNVMGFGAFSEAIEIVAAKVPDQPNAPRTLINNIFVRIEWDLPYINSAEIEAYEVFVANNLGEFILEQTYCKGDVEPVLSERYCEIPMIKLREGVYSLEFNGLVSAKLKARNMYGWSMVSDANTEGALVQTQPIKVFDL